jgi:hypothetical protein
MCVPSIRLRKPGCAGLSTEIDSWRHLQSDNIEFTIKRLREPIDADHGG